jgi:S-adenosylmethionine-diacylglycerol 3-amino-3-carboxypropyl transferase
VRHFDSTLNYSSVNEDWRTELAALHPDAAGPILCITGSGDRPLNLLAHTTGRVVAIDCNPSQNHLLRLKVAALETLRFEDYGAYLGLTDAAGRWRLAIHARLDARLPGSSRAYWRRHRRQIARGVLYAGRFERHFRRIGRLARLVRRERIERLLGFESLEEQRAFMREQWDTAGWRLVFGLAVCPLVSRVAFRDPAFYRHACVPVGPTLHARMCRLLEGTLARDCFMLGLVFRGRLPEGDLPPYLTPDGVEVIRERLAQLSIVDDRLEHYLSCTAPQRFTRFSLSDLPSYLSVHDYARLMALVLHRAAPEARIVIRQFLSRYSLPPAIEARIEREHQLETRLAQEDHAFAYEFVIATPRH